MLHGPRPFGAQPGSVRRQELGGAGAVLIGMHQGGERCRGGLGGDEHHHHAGGERGRHAIGRERGRWSFVDTEEIAGGHSQSIGEGGAVVGISRPRPRAAEGTWIALGKLSEGVARLSEQLRISNARIAGCQHERLPRGIVRAGHRFQRGRASIGMPGHRVVIGASRRVHPTSHGLRGRVHASRHGRSRCRRRPRGVRVLADVRIA
mmetsp:Transcript_7596/g.18842  ORF Transcript_7596/g.18842 Transcript_7596/m.18842 type:complete len:206 (+) Transcript_7596:711-1328(+)